MSIELNHTIVHVKDRWAASRAVGQVLGLPEATAYGPFAELKLDNGASLDFMDTEGEIPGQHYAFLVSEEDFDVIHGRLQGRLLVVAASETRETGDLVPEEDRNGDQRRDGHLDDQTA